MVIEKDYFWVTPPPYFQLQVWAIEWIVVPFIWNSGAGTRFGGEYDQSNLGHVECEVPGDSQVSRGDKQIKRVLGRDLGRDMALEVMNM